MADVAIETWASGDELDLIGVAPLLVDLQYIACQFARASDGVVLLGNTPHRRSDFVAIRLRELSLAVNLAVETITQRVTDVECLLGV